MPIPYPPTTFSCPVCDWSRTVIPGSDALISGVNWYDRCPQCRYRLLKQRRATSFEILTARVRYLFGDKP